jgi:hypothetical protein
MPRPRKNLQPQSQPVAQVPEVAAAPIADFTPAMPPAPVQQTTAMQLSAPTTLQGNAASIDGLKSQVVALQQQYSVESLNLQGLADYQMLASDPANQISRTESASRIAKAAQVKDALVARRTELEAVEEGINLAKQTVKVSTAVFKLGTAIEQNKQAENDYKTQLTLTPLKAEGNQHKVRLQAARTVGLKHRADRAEARNQFELLRGSNQQEIDYGAGA